MWCAAPTVVSAFGNSREWPIAEPMSCRRSAEPVMSLRKVLLRGMLWSLGFAAATGVLAVLVRGGGAFWRVTATGFTTAAACGLMLPVSAMIDREKSRTAGLLGMCLVITEFLLALLAIWQFGFHVFGVRWEGEIVATMLILAAGGVVMVKSFDLTHMPQGATAGRVMLWTTAFAVAVFLFAAWAARTTADHRGERFWETGWAIVALGLPAVLALVGHEANGAPRRPWVHWRWLGVCSSVTACAMWVLEIWIGRGSDVGFVVFCVLASIAAVVAHANISLRCPLGPGQTWVRSGSVVAAMLTAGTIDLLCAHDRFPGMGLGEALLGRIASAGGIVTGCGTLSLCVLARINRKVDLEADIAEFVEAIVVCPRCRKKQSISLGTSACSACGLRISIRVEEPRCPQCDYLLYGLRCDRCPECGTAIAA